MRYEAAKLYLAGDSLAGDMATHFLTVRVC